MPNSLIVVQLVDRLPPPGHSTHPDALYSANQRVARLASQARCKRAPNNRILRLMGARDIGCATGARYPGPEGTRFVRQPPYPKPPDSPLWRASFAAQNWREVVVPVWRQYIAVFVVDHRCCHSASSVNCFMPLLQSFCRVVCAA